MSTKKFPVGDVQRRPTHPGEVLREDVLPALRLSVADAARELGVSRQTLHRILAETSPVTPLMALRLGRFCGNGPDVWVRMQAACDIWEASEKFGNQLSRIPSHASA